MTEFQTFLGFGFHHILDISAYDHILFIGTLVAAYPVVFWKRIILLITAFTIGHSVTLAPAAFGILRIDQDLTEVLIAGTVLAASVYNLLPKISFPADNARIVAHYLITLCFGFIHGLGFAGQFRDLLGGGTELLTALLAFNIGVELGQIIVVICLLAITGVCVTLFKFRHQTLRSVISWVAALIAAGLIVTRIAAL